MFLGAGLSFPNVGGNWSNGTNAGLWYVSVGYSSTGTNSNIGGRLATKTAEVKRSRSFFQFHLIGACVQLLANINQG